MRLVGIHRSPLSFSLFSLCPKGPFDSSCLSIRTNFSRPLSPSSHGFSVIHHNRRPLFSVRCRSHNAFSKSDDVQRGPSNGEDMLDKNESSRKSSFSSKEVLEKLKKYGISGVLSYGLLNTVYYTIAFLLVWFYVAPAPGRMGYVAAVERFLKVMAMVWAGSQVTKLIRAGGQGTCSCTVCGQRIDMVHSQVQV
ncbi:PREDICTED: uncharacterized protein LOC104824199 isoform X2 [Tarenaya hassleriana]|uniref:uncharacterized protein LOC104824199 isoform X2 n=1 Tax=Tarenaya hassleriana TaxID=28532 RepID=UPI00053C4135|nr:PREDICTED: uncharacterized protein LOC104824199 isoform X2 [Tarenaya hassleriana]